MISQEPPPMPGGGSGGMLLLYDPLSRTKLDLLNNTRLVSQKEL